MTTVDKIRYILLKTSWNKSKLARTLGVNKSTITLWLKGGEPKDKYKREIERYYTIVRYHEWKCKQNTLRAKPRFEPKVLSKRGKIRIMFPYYQHQRRVMERK